MSVSNETILHKMQAELSLAIENKEIKSKKMIEHIMKVHLLCELLLEDDQLELHDKKMLSMLSSQANREQTEERVSQSSLDHQGANGDSIFDF